MFWHNFKYSFIIGIRDKSTLFWGIAFTVILGTLFYVSFGSSYSRTEIVQEIPVAVCIEDENVEGVFETIVENLVGEDENTPMISPAYVTDMDEAEKLLLDKDVQGIFYSENGELKLIINENSIKTGILSTVAGNYHQMKTIMERVYANGAINPEQAMETLNMEADYNIEKPLTESDMDSTIEYFYNLIAMGCIFASFTGIKIAQHNRANLSSLGARRSVIIGNRSRVVVANIAADLLLLYVCQLIAMLYLTIIGVNFGDKVWQILLLVFAGTCTGVTMGYFVGNISKLSENVKESIVVGSSLILCFLSGLMFASIKPVLRDNCPLFNKLNPAALIADSFSALNIYNTNNQYWINVITLFGWSLFFIVMSAIIGRRKNYASI